MRNLYTIIFGFVVILNSIDLSTQIRNTNHPDADGAAAPAHAPPAPAAPAVAPAAPAPAVGPAVAPADDHPFPRGLFIPGGHRVIVNDFIIGVIDDYGESQQVRFSGEGVEVHVSGQPRRPLGPIEWVRLMRDNAPRFHQALQIPIGRRIIVNDFIVGVEDARGERLRVVFNGQGVKVHVSGQPIRLLGPLEFARVMRDNAPRYPQALEIPIGHRIIVNDFIVGVVNTRGEKLQLRYNGQGVEAHVSGQPIRPLGPIEWARMMRNSLNG